MKGRLLRRSWDLHWTNQGDGVRTGRYGTAGHRLYGLVGPDGALGDTATPDGIADIRKTYEAAANAMYEGLARRMVIYANGGEPRKRRLAERFVQAGGEPTE